MRTRHSSLVVAALLFFPTSMLGAQSAPNPSGHWAGVIKAPGHEVAVQVDLARDANGALRGAFTGTDVKGFPLSDIVLDRAAVRFQLKVNGGGSFSGTISDDGRTIAGDFTTIDGAYTIPFTLTREGEAQLDPPAKSPHITTQLEGTWHATLDANGQTMRVVLRLANQADGTASGTIAVVDQGGVEIPIAAIEERAAAVTLDVKIVNGTYDGALNADGSELAGTWTQGPFVAPLNFRRGDAGK